MDIIKWIIFAAVGAMAAIWVGSRFLAEMQKARDIDAPWYRPYISLPGLIILAALAAPLVIRWLRSQ